jgi:O-antigen/teichoic acid export membrane protein
MTDQRSANPPQSLSRRAASGAAWIATEMIAVQGASLLVFMVMARFIGPAEFGIISICIVVLQASKTLLIDNFAYAVIRKSEAHRLEYTTAFWMTVAVSLLSFLAIETGAHLLQQMFEISGLSEAMHKMGFVSLVMGLSRTHECWMFRHFEFRSLAIRSIAGAIVGGGVGIALAVCGYGIEALIAQQIITFTTSLVALWIACPWRPDFAVSRSAAIEILRFVVLTTPSAIMGILNQNCDTILVAYFFGPTNTGLYSVGKRLRLAMQLVVSAPINGIALPSLADAQHDPERLRRVLSYAIGILCTVCAPLFLGVSAVANDVIPILFGVRWAAAAPILEWLAAGGLMAVLLTYNDTVFVVRGRPIWMFYISGTYSLLAIFGFVIFSHLGNSYLAAPFVIPYIVTVPLSMWLCSQLTGLALSDWLRILPALVSAVIMFVAIRLLGGTLIGIASIPRLAILCPTGLLIYIGALAIFDWGTLKNMAKLIRDIVRSKPARVTEIPNGSENA